MSIALTEVAARSRGNLSENLEKELFLRATVRRMFLNPRNDVVCVKEVSVPGE